MNSDALEKSLLEELQCPVCDHYMCPPICQCQNGHSICEQCFLKVRTCPRCRAPKSHTARCYGLEAIHAKLNVPCRYAIAGCDFITLGQNIKLHQEFCRHAPKSCPFRLYDSCGWKDIQSKLKNHLTRKHSSNFYVKEKQKFLCQNFRAIKKYHYIYAVIFAYNEFFRMTWEVNEATDMTRWALYLMGSPEEASRYSYKIEFSNGSQSSCESPPLVWKSPCTPAPDRDDIKFLGHTCLYLHKQLLNTYCEVNGDLNYRVTIYAHRSKEVCIPPLDISKQFKELSTTE